MLVDRTNRANLPKGNIWKLSPKQTSKGGQVERFRTLLWFCLKRMDGCFENGITASDDVSTRQMGRDRDMGK